VAQRAKAVERVRWEQLDAVQRYAEADSCRRTSVLRYFGDAAAGSPEGRCCDVCDPPPDAPRRPAAPPDDVVAAAVEVAASAAPSVGRAGIDGVLRGVESYRGRYGTHPLFGACARLRPAQVRAALDTALGLGRLVQTEGRYPLILPPGAEARRGVSNGVVPAPTRRRTEVERPRPEGVDEALADRLRAWRREAAREREVPAYVVFSNRTLDEIAARRPSTSAELLAVPGVGPAFLALHGAAVLELVATARS
jgi:ATP-dependent DNA helicase RecQ